MKKHFNLLIVCLLIPSFLFLVIFPGNAWADFFDFGEDTLKTTGIIIGITFGVLLVIVLIAGTIKDMKEGDDEDVFARLPMKHLNKETLAFLAPGFESYWDDLKTQNFEDDRPIFGTYRYRSNLMPVPTNFQWGTAQNLYPHALSRDWGQENSHHFYKNPLPVGSRYKFLPPFKQYLLCTPNAFPGIGQTEDFYETRSVRRFVSLLDQPISSFYKPYAEISLKTTSPYNNRIETEVFWRLSGNSLMGIQKPSS